MGNTIWELIPKQGIRQDEVEIFLVWLDPQSAHPYGEDSESLIVI